MDLHAKRAMRETVARLIRQAEALPEGEIRDGFLAALTDSLSWADAVIHGKKTVIIKVPNLSLGARRR